MADIFGDEDDNTLTGTSGFDRIYGYGGDDILYGMGGTDFLYGGAGNDTLYGGDGDDYLYYEIGGDDWLYGNDGNDRFNIFGPDVPDEVYFVRAFGGNGDDRLVHIDLDEIKIRFDGGNGSDFAQINFGNADSVFIFNMGTGQDRVQVGDGSIRGDGKYQVSLGTGIDEILFDAFPTNFVISDFETGVSGDIVLLNTLDEIQNWDEQTNLFATGHFSLFQDGTDAILKLDFDGTGGSAATIDLIIFENTLTGDIESYNLGGFNPDGSAIEATTINGISGNDDLLGTVGSDIIFGLGGFNIVKGLFGDDIIYGGASIDRLFGGFGDDTLYGGEGNDTLYYEIGGDDQLFGGSGNDDFWVTNRESDSVGSVLVEGGAGDDFLRFIDSAEHNVIYRGGAGDDSALVWFGNSDSSFIMNMGVGNDQIEIGNLYNSNNISNSASDLFLITLGAGQDLINITDIGIETNRIVVPLPTQITITDFDKGTLGDVIQLNFSDNLEAWDGVVNPFDTNVMRLMQVTSDTILQVRVTNQTSGFDEWADLITFQNSNMFNFTAENFDGFAAVGVNLSGTPDDETLNGTQRADQILGNDGDDIINGYNGHDIISGGSGLDTIRAGSGDDIADGSEGDDTILGNAGDDNLFGGDGIDLIIGGGGNDTINGESGDDQLSGQSGDDVINGGDGVDNILGGSGMDEIYGGGESDIVNAGGGNDIVNGEEGNDDLSGGAGSDVIFGGAGSDNIYGNNQSDELFGGDGLDVLEGGAGNDFLDGGADVDVLYGGASQDTLLGGAGGDVLFGNGGGDSLDGGDGNDTLDGGGGNDTLTGGAGADFFTQNSGFKTDRITDFENGIDVISFSGNNSANSFADVMAAAFQQGTAVRIELNPNNILILENFDLADLDASDFIF